MQVSTTISYMPRYDGNLHVSANSPLESMERYLYSEDDISWLLTLCITFPTRATRCRYARMVDHAWKGVRGGLLEDILFYQCLSRRPRQDGDKTGCIEISRIWDSYPECPDMWEWSSVAVFTTDRCGL